MKDATHHLKRLQKKVIKSTKNPAGSQKENENIKKELTAEDLAKANNLEQVFERRPDTNRRPFRRPHNRFLSYTVK